MRFAEHGIGERVEGGFDGGHGRMRQDLLRLRRGGTFKRRRRRLKRRLPMQRFGCGSFGKFEVIPRFDLVERRLRRVRQRHLVGEFKYIAVRQGRPYLRRGCRFIEAGQQCVNIVLTIGRRGRRGRWRDGRRRGLEGGGAVTFAAVACATGMADGGMSFITGLAAGAVAAGFSGFAGAGLEGFSAAVGFASSSAMMRRIDAKISSIEGSWTFAGCVISDSTSKPFYTKP